MKQALINFVIVQFLFTAFASAATLYKCKKEDGQLAFQDKPCQNETLQIQELKTKKQSDPTEESESSSKFKLTKSKLFGTWTNLKEPKDIHLRSLWTFTSSLLTIKKHTGYTFSREYEIKNNVLVIHHPAEDNQKAFTEEIEVVNIENKKLTWGEGGELIMRNFYKLY